MKVTNRELTEAKGALDKLLQEKMPVRVSWGLAKLSKKVGEPIEAFILVRDGLFKKYNVKPTQNEEGVVSLTSEVDGNLEKFSEEFKELLDLTVELVVEKVKLPEKVAATCDKCNHNMDKQFEIEPVILMALEKFVEV